MVVAVAALEMMAVAAAAVAVRLREVRQPGLMALLAGQNLFQHIKHFGFLQTQTFFREALLALAIAPPLYLPVPQSHFLGKLF
jgi:hypothetical protein